MKRTEVCLYTVLIWILLAVSGLPVNATTSTESDYNGQRVVIGVLAYRGTEQALEMWSPTAEYLTAMLPEYSFTIQPLHFDQINLAVAQGEVDFILANPSIYVELESLYGVSRIATIKNLIMGQPHTRFGGVIFTRTDQEDLKDLRDLKGKSFMAVDEASLGGWHMAWREIQGKGIDPYRDFRRLAFGGTHDAVVYAVLNGEVDAGTVRTDVLESMAADGKINLTMLRVLNEQHNADFPLLLSTRLYPEWPLAKVKHTPLELAELVAIALIQIPSDSPAATAASIAGWTIPLDYQPVHECLNELGICPYGKMAPLKLTDVLLQYWYVGLLTVLSTLTVSGVGYMFYILRINRRLNYTVSELANSRNELETKTRELARKNDELKQIDRLKNEFISTVSHELRTPLTSIGGALGLIAGGVTGDIPAKAREVLDIALKNSHRLVKLINDILDIEKIESGRMEFRMKPVLLERVVTQALESNRAYGEQYGIQFTLTNELPGVKVYSDSDRLIQVITNLLSNAAKFSPRGSSVEVTSRRQGDMVRLAVSDRGIGIPEDFHSQVFQRFAQADASNRREKGGTGLGLNISKAIIEQLGGRIGFEVNVGGGTTFYFELPEWKQETPAPVRQEAFPGQPRVLVCDDDRDAATLISLMLAQSGMNADIAYNAEQAKQLLLAENYDALTLDILLPDQNGLVLLQELREQEETASLPVLIVSIVAQQEQTKLEGGAFSVIDWINKPIDRERLVAATKRAVLKTDRPRILHVENDPDVCSVVAAILIDVADTGCAASVQDALQKLHNETWHLIILDIDLPDQPGIALLPYLKDIWIPVIIFSAFDVSEDLLQQVEAALVKSRASNEQLKEAILAALKSGGSSDGGSK